jgi:cytoskeletal protein RodZ
VSDHRRTVTRRAFVLPAWALVSSAVLVLAGAAWLAVLLLTGPGDDGSPAAAPTPSAAATTATPSPSESATAEPTEAATPEPSESPEPTPSATPDVDRSAVAVSVLNASRTPGLARSVSQQVTADGWTVGAVGNWRGYSAANTVHYPAGREAQARQLADDLGIQAVQPIVNGMSGQRLTIVLVSPLT